MKYEHVVEAKFIARPNRFIAKVYVDGKEETVHVKNTGRCRELLHEGSAVYLNAPDSPNRKTKYDLIAVIKDNGILFNIDSQAPNTVVKEWLSKQDFSYVKPEYTYGESRIDFYMERDLAGNKKEKILMEVKGCTLERDLQGFFPDAPTERGVKHIYELIHAVKDGYTAYLAFVIQMEGVKTVLPNIDTDPAFGEALIKAKEAGVNVIFFTTKVKPDELYIDGYSGGII